MRSGRGGYFSPAHQNRHISTGFVAGIRRSDDARDVVGRKHEEENAGRLAGLGRGCRRHPVAAERAVNDWCKARLVSNGDQWVRPRTCPYRRFAAVGNAACQRHDRLPPRVGARPPTGRSLPQPNCNRLREPAPCQLQKLYRNPYAMSTNLFWAPWDFDHSQWHLGPS